MGEPTSDFTDLAGGHRNDFKVTRGGECIIKCSNLREGHFYAWIHALCRSFPEGPTPAVHGVEEESTVSGVQNGNVISECSYCSSAREDDQCQAFSSWCLSSCPFGCEDGKTENECPLLLLKELITCHEHGSKSFSLLHTKALISWIPRLLGASAAETSATGTEWKSPRISLKMENLLFGIPNPVVIDFKMGTQLYGDDAPLDKRQRAARYSEERGAVRLGISFSGLWGRIDGKVFLWEGGSRARGKDGTNKIPTTVEDYVKLLEAFLLTSGRGGIAAGKSIITKLLELKCIFQLQTFVAFHGSSLLIVLDAEDYRQHLDGVGNAGRFGCNCTGSSALRHVKVKMIDFAHVTMGKNGLDSGYLQGLQTLINAFEGAVDLLEERDAPVYGWEMLASLRCSSPINKGDEGGVS